MATDRSATASGPASSPTTASARRIALTVIWSLSGAWWLAVAVYGVALAASSTDDAGIWGFGAAMALVGALSTALYVVHITRLWRGRTGRTELVTAVGWVGLSGVLLWAWAPGAINAGVLSREDPAHPIAVILLAAIVVNLTVVILLRRGPAVGVPRPEPGTSPAL